MNDMDATNSQEDGQDSDATLESTAIKAEATTTPPTATRPNGPTPGEASGTAAGRRRKKTALTAEERSPPKLTG